VEAVPFVILAALGSLALGLAAWFRPRWALLLVGVGAAMLLFAVLDVREVFHQSDESKTGLAVLAGAIAALHAAAAAVAVLMARRATAGDHAATGATMAT
jgi:nitrate reductase gamma subunit